MSDQTKIDDGGPAFPSEKIIWDAPNNPKKEISRIPVQGMTLRDWFAGQAMLGMLASNCLMRNIATDCYDLADVMLKVRKK